MHHGSRTFYAFQDACVCVTDSRLQTRDEVGQAPLCVLVFKMPNYLLDRLKLPDSVQQKSSGIKEIAESNTLPQA